MKIGITERGDAGLDFTWYNAVKTNKVDGAVLITKNITSEFTDKVLELHNCNKKLIVMATCTGFGGTVIEPNVPVYTTQLDSLKALINRGFPAKQCVLRIDPIFPTEKGIKKVRKVVEYADEIGVLKDVRVRVSILDEYTHVKQRFRDAGLPTVYGEGNTAEFFLMTRTAIALHNLHKEYGISFYTCAEPKLIKFLKAMHGEDQKVCIAQGCISNEDLVILGLPEVDLPVNMQKREGCLCLSCKTELLKNKTRCPNGCLYCYWKDVK